MKVLQQLLRALKPSFAKVLCAALFVVLFQTNLAANTLLVATGPGPGHPPIVKLTVDTGAGIDTTSFQAYPTSFRGGVRVAVGDVNGDGAADIITGPGPGMDAQIRVFDGANGRRIRNFLAFPSFFRGGVYVAAGDVNGDGKADVIVAPDFGMPSLVRVFDGNSGAVLRTFFAYSPVFLGGVRVAAGDVNGDGFAEIITGAGPGGGPHVKVFNGTNLNLLQSFFAYSPSFQGGVFVAAGYVNDDGLADIITGAGAGGGPHVKVFDGTNLNVLHSFFAYDPSFIGGVRVAAGDVNGDRFSDIITGAGPGAGPHVKLFDGTNLNVLHSFFAYDPNFTGGVFVAGAVTSRRPRS